jgi:hypothetical protein
MSDEREKGVAATAAVERKIENNSDFKSTKIWRPSPSLRPLLLLLLLPQKRCTCPTPTPLRIYPRLLCKAAAAARIVGKPDVIHAAKSGNLQLVKDHVVVDAGCVHMADGGWDSMLHSRLKLHVLLQPIFPMFNKFQNF